ncbi:MAG: NAD(+) synthase [Halanaerobiales bacterium]
MSLEYGYVEKKLVNWLQEKVADAGKKGAVVGLSGGLDSSVTAVLCKKAFSDNVQGIIMPCYSKEKDAADAELVADKFNIEYLSKDLSPILDKYMEVLEDSTEYKNNMAVANMKPRLRMITLYYYAAKKDYLVIGTDNWSELKVGYFTKHGDGGIDLAPIGRLVKTEVRELAGYLGVPDKIIKKAPSAGLWKEQTDEAEMGFSYETLDKYILTGKAPADKKERIEELINKNRHKVEPIPMPERKELINN